MRVYKAPNSVKSAYHELFWHCLKCTTTDPEICRTAISELLDQANPQNDEAIGCESAPIPAEHPEGRYHCAFVGHPRVFNQVIRCDRFKPLRETCWKTPHVSSGIYKYQELNSINFDNFMELMYVIPKNE